MRRAVAALLGAAAAASLASCSAGDEPTNTAAESAAAPRADHKNIAYSIGGQTVRLVDGVAEVQAAPGSAAKIVTRYLGNDVRGPDLTKHPQHRHA